MFRYLIIGLNVLALAVPASAQNCVEIRLHSAARH